MRLNFWSNPAAKDTSNPLRAAVSEVREQRNTGVVIGTEDTDARLLSMLGMGGQTMAGVTVNERTALGFAAVWACVMAISQDIAALPCQLFREKPTGGKERVFDHPATRLLNLQASPLQNAMPHRMQMTATVLLHGNAYARIDWGRRYTPKALLYKHPRETEVRESGGRLFYKFWGDPQIYSDYDVVHLRGLTLDEKGILGLSVLSAHRESMGTGLAAQRTGANFYGNGAKVSGALESDKTLTKDAAARLRENFASIYQGVDNAGKVVVLEEGLKFKNISLSPADAQFLETRKYTWKEVCAIFRVPPHKTGDLERSTNNNIEQQGLDYTTSTLMPWLVNFEQEYRLKLLRTDEVETYYWRHNLSALLRGDSAARGAFYRVMTDIGVYSINEVREFEDQNSIGAEGDVRFVQVNRQTLANAIKAKPKEPTGTGNQPPPTDE